MKYNVTNVSAHSDKGARNVFLTEAGKLLKAGESIACNRIDSGTWGLEKAGLLKIQEGNFPTPPIFTDKPVAPPEDETATGPKPEDVAVRKAEDVLMDQRIAAAKAAEDAKALGAAGAEVVKEVLAAPSATSELLPATPVDDATPAADPAPSSSKKSRGKV